MHQSQYREFYWCEILSASNKSSIEPYSCPKFGSNG